VGASFDGSGRYLIGPYATYRTEDQLYVFHQCAISKNVPAASYYLCFVVNQDYDANPVPLPLVEQPKPATKTKKKRRTR